jgi:hypothetical protein
VTRTILNVLGVVAVWVLYHALLKGWFRRRY